MNRRQRILLLVVVAAVGTSLASCSAAPPTPDGTANAFLAALSGGDATALGATTDAPDAASAALTAARAALEPTTVAATLSQVQTTGDTATVLFDATWTLPKDRVWTYSGSLPMVRSGAGWQVRWSPADLHPKLAVNQTLALRTQDAPTATVLDRNGTPVLTPAALVQVTLDPTKAGDVTAVAGALATALGPLDSSITQKAIVEAVAAAPTKPYVVASLRDVDYQGVKPAIHDLPGVTFPTRAALLTPSRTFAPALMSQVRHTVQDQLDGKAGWTIVTVGPTGADVTTLAQGAARPAPSVSLTLDSGIQTAAQDAVNAVAGRQAMVVVLQPSTGDVLAVAQNPEADGQGTPALNGLYPPGSTFKIVTASAALQAGVATVDTPLDCPGTTVIGPRRIPNYNEFALGTVPLSLAFAKSCNTTFAQLATQLGASGLTDAAHQVGLGVDYAIDGITTVTGTVPPAPDTVKRAEDGFGQGDVVASPFGMALAAATVASGATPVPTLIRGATATTVTNPPPAVPQPVLGGVRTMMRDVVTEGTATSLQGLGQVYGKTGEAQFGDGTQSHAWFVGYRGDLAFATLVVDGGSSSNAVAVTKQLLAAIPAG